MRIAFPGLLVEFDLPLVIGFRNFKVHTQETVITSPKLAFFHKREYFLISNRFLITQDDELLVVFNENGDIFTPKRKRRVGDDDIALVEELKAFSVAKVAVAF